MKNNDPQKTWSGLTPVSTRGPPQLSLPSPVVEGGGSERHTEFEVEYREG